MGIRFFAGVFLFAAIFFAGWAEKVFKVCTIFCVGAGSKKITNIDFITFSLHFHYITLSKQIYFL